GLFARRPADLIRTFHALRGFDARDPHSVPAVDQHYPGKRRAGLVTMPDDVQVSADMTAACESAAKMLAQHGWDVQPVVLPIDFAEVKALARTLLSAEAAHTMSQAFNSDMLAQLGNELQDLVRDGLQLSSHDYWAATEKRNQITAQINAVLNDYQHLILPSAIGAAPSGLTATGDPICTVLTSISGLPALNMPLGQDRHGMPLGVQLVGRKFTDTDLLFVPIEAGMGNAGVVDPAPTQNTSV